MRNMCTTIRLISSAMGLGGCDNILRRISLMIGMGAAVRGSSPLLHNILELILHSSHIVFSLCVNDSLIERNLGISTLTVCDLDACLLRGSIR